MGHCAKNHPQLRPSLWSQPYVFGKCVKKNYYYTCTYTICAIIVLWCRYINICWFVEEHCTFSNIGPVRFVTLSKFRQLNPDCTIYAMELLALTFSLLFCCLLFSGWILESSQSIDKTLDQWCYFPPLSKTRTHKQHPNRTKNGPLRAGNDNGSKSTTVICTIWSQNYLFRSVINYRLIKNWPIFTAG